MILVTHIGWVYFKTSIRIKRINIYLKLKDIEKKKEWKGKRCILDQDTSIVKDMVQIIDDESIVVKDELAYVIDLIQNSDDNDRIVSEKN